MSHGFTTRRRKSVIAAAAILVVGGYLVSTQIADAAVPPPPDGFALVFSDDFEGDAGSTIDTTKWQFDLGTGYPGGAANWGTGEIEVMTNKTENVSLDGQGNLAITPIGAGTSWESGRIETVDAFGAEEGEVTRIEGRIQQPDVNTTNGLGYWSAFWMLGEEARPVAATNWPGIGELDITEGINGRGSTFATMHCGVVSGGPCNELTGKGGGEELCGTCTTAFHTYAVEHDRSVTPEQLRWFLDDQQIFSIAEDELDAATWANATDHGFNIILNVAMGGGFPAAFGGGPDANTVSGKPMLVDYVAVFKRAA
jgi:beta-glucanase (GH16 family)